MRFWSSRFVSLVALVVGLPAHGADPHPFTVHDLLAMDRISDPQPQPHGERVAFVVRTTDLEANRGRTDLWSVNLDGSGLVRLTSDPAADTDPRWSADGKSLYFLSTRSGSTQVWRLALAGGDPVQVTHLPLDVANLTVSPDGGRLAFSVDVFPDCQTLDCTKKRLDEKEKRKASGRLYDGEVGFFRHWDSWSDGRRSHLFVQPAGGGEPIDVTRGMNADTPSKPFGGAEEYAFSPDGRTLAFAARQGGREEPWSTNLDLYLVPADGSAAPRNLTAANRATDTQPAFSPDGKTLAYLAMSRPGFESDRLRIRLRDLGSGEERELAEAWDHSPDGLQFSDDGRTLYAAAHDTGQLPLFAIDVASGQVRKLVAEGTVRSPRTAGERLVFGLDTLRGPTELYTVRRDGSGLQAITRINAAKLAAAQMGEAQQFSFRGWNDETVYGWAVKPVGFREGKRYPLAFLIHGGPQGSFDNEFHYRWNAQAYAGAGYAVVMIDFHGSTGYGQAFTDAIRSDWGGKPLEDLQKGLKAALERFPWIDGERACALGASYGGFMTNWIAGAWPDGFKCLVTHDGIFDQRTMYYSTEELWFPEWEQGGPYWTNAAGHERHNPAQLVDRWRTPMLVVQGGLDYRVPESQGISTFNTLQRRGIASQFLYFPDENHWVLKPANSVLWHDTVLAWLDRWLKAAAGSAKPQ
jgi:dipeptidyl aminopeptidase/acylaminoacyl peptidase